MFLSILVADVKPVFLSILLADVGPVAAYLEHDIQLMYHATSRSRTFTCDVGWRFRDGWTSKTVDVNTELDVIGTADYVCLGIFTNIFFPIIY